MRYHLKNSCVAIAIIAVAVVGGTGCGDSAGNDVAGQADISAAADAPTNPDTTATSDLASPSTAVTTAQTAPATAAFPVTVTHTFGDTTIERMPERIVSIGFTDHDTLLALGVKPVAIRQWYGDYEYVWPWAEEALGDLKPALIPSADLNFEQIAALNPDLIIGLYIGLEEEEYATLSAIAPMVAQPAGYPSFGAPWQVITRVAGAATGRSEQAEDIIAELEGQFAMIRAEHPEYEGAELAYAGVYGSDTANFYVETDGSTRMSVLQDLGFVVPDELAALGTDSFYHDISAEQLGLLDHDVVLWESAVIELLPAVEESSIYKQLDVAVEDRDIFLTDPVIAGAMAHATVLSLPTVLEFLVPELDRAISNLNR